MHVPDKLAVRADARSILCSILNYFSDEHSCIQELLQNARRAEASEVRVEIDSRARRFSVRDNGHGVLDPQDLLNLGKSEWAEDIASEQPAGMGLFSVFKLGGLAEVRSGDWRLSMDYAAMCRGEPAQLETGLPKFKGTEVSVSALHDGSAGHPAGFALRWATQAEFMPFETAIAIDGTTRTVERFNLHHVPEGTLRIERPWGYIDFHTDRPPRGPSHQTMLIQQGVATRITNLTCGNFPWLRIHARPGTVNFTLPDRDAILRDGKYDRLVEDIRQVAVDEVIRRIKEFSPDARRQLANIVYGWSRLRAIELPEDLQRVHLVFEDNCLLPMSKSVVAERLAAGALACAHTLSHPGVLSLMPYELLCLDRADVGLFRLMFPDVPVIQRVSFEIAPDERGALLWRCGELSLRFDNGETRIFSPVADRAVLTDAALAAEFRPKSDEQPECAKHFDFAVVHTCKDAVNWPDLEPWYEMHDEDMTREEAEEHWRTSEYAVQIAATWPGVPACDVSLDELVILLGKRLVGDKVCRLRFTEATFEPDWDNRMNIRSATVEVLEKGEVTRTVRLVEDSGYLQEVTP